MSAPTSYVRGTFRDSQGNLRVSVVVTFRPLDTPKVLGGDIVTSQLISATTDGSGRIGYSPSIVLVSGYYQVVATDVDAFNIYVPDDGLVYDLANIRTTTTPGASRQISVDPSLLMSNISETNSIAVTRSGDRDAARTRFAVLCDVENSSEMVDMLGAIAAVDPDELLTSGINPTGSSGTIDAFYGYYLGTYIYPYLGSLSSASADSINHLWNALASSDWSGGSVSALASYFPYTGNERYYVKSIGSGLIDIFVLSSSASETDGNTYTSTQGVWLQTQLAASTARWKVVFFSNIHAASVNSYSFPAMDWPFALWGASCVIGCGSRIFEHFVKDGIPYFSAGAIRSSLNTIGTPISGSVFRYATMKGILYFDVNQYSIKFGITAEDGSIPYTYELVGSASGGLELTVKTAGGIFVDSTGINVDFGTADDQALSGSSLYQTILSGKIHHFDSVPTVDDVRQNPALKNTLILVGNDPVDAYFFHPVSQTMVLFSRSSLGSYSYNPSPTPQLDPPTITPASGTRSAVVVSHTEPGVSIYFAVGQYDSFALMDDFPTNNIIPIYSSERKVWVAAYAVKAGFRDSEVTIQSYRTP